ncbi:hypothetical protein B0T26DRAFT_613935, partial [Lasiosphaeria miniovina]
MPHSDTASRVQALTLQALGWKNEDIEKLTGIKARALNKLLDRAIERGFEPSKLRIQDSYVANSPKSGRPQKQEASEE